MDNLVHEIARLSVECRAPTSSLLGEWVNTTRFPLIVLPLQASTSRSEPVGVYACQDIPAGMYLGDIQGERMYSWEVEPHPHVLWVEDDMVIDCRQTPRCILAMIREGFYEGLQCNCELVVSPQQDYQFIQVGMRTIQNIPAGSELVYYHPCLYT